MSFELRSQTPDHVHPRLESKNRNDQQSLFEYTPSLDRAHPYQDFNASLFFMEHRQPWLASFAVPRLTDLLIHDGRGHKCDFNIKSHGDTGPLDIRQNAPYFGYAYITDVSGRSS